MDIARWKVRLLPPAEEALRAIKDRRVQGSLKDALRRLEDHPEYGKPLGGELAGCLSVRAASQRYRIVYRLDRDMVEVLVVIVGLRRAGERDDVYELAKRWLRRGLLPE